MAPQLCMQPTVGMCFHAEEEAEALQLYDLWRFSSCLHK